MDSLFNQGVHCVIGASSNSINMLEVYFVERLSVVPVGVADDCALVYWNIEVVDSEIRGLGKVCADGRSITMV